MKAIILGGYHNGTEIETKYDWIDLYEIPLPKYLTYEDTPFPTHEQLKVHRYKRVHLEYVKDYRRYEQPYGYGMVEAYWKLEDIGLFVPSDTTEAYISVLKDVFKTLLQAKFKQHTNVLGG